MVNPLNISGESSPRKAGLFGTSRDSAGTQVVPLNGSLHLDKLVLTLSVVSSLNIMSAWGLIRKAF